MDLLEPGVLRDDRRDHRSLERAGGGHDIARLDDAVGGFGPEPGAPVVLAHRGDLDAAADRRADFLRVGEEVVGDLVLGGERVRVEIDEFQAGNRSCQAGPFATSESHRSDRHRSAMRPRSRTRCETPWLLRCSLIARPA